MSGSGRILAIDDVQSNLTILQAILCEPEFHVTGVTSVESAFAALASGSFDVILLDIVLPELDGYSVARRIKKTAGAEAVPIIFLTALRGEEEVVRGFEAGGVDFVSKPFSPLELLHRVRTHLTLKEKNEELAVKARELGEANRSRDRFFSILAHDLKSPLAGLVSLTGQMLERFEAFTAGELFDALKVVGQASKAVWRLLDNLLEWGRSQLGAIRLEPQLLLLTPLVDEALDSLKEAFNLKNIAVSVAGAMHCVHADRNTLMTIVRNLLSNALKFTPSGGSVTVSCRSHAGQAELSVADTGVGIPSNQILELFQIDSKFSTPGTDNEPGTGLGLILCADFAARNRGSLSAESREGHGSTFYLRLPIAPA